MYRSFVRQTRSTLLHVSFFCLSDAFFPLAESISFPSIASDFSSVSSFFAAVLISCLSGSSFYVAVASACLPFGFCRLSVSIIRSRVARAVWAYGVEDVAHVYNQKEKGNKLLFIPFTFF